MGYSTELPSVIECCNFVPVLRLNLSPRIAPIAAERINNNSTGNLILRKTFRGSVMIKANGLNICRR